MDYGLLKLSFLNYYSAGLHHIGWYSCVCVFYLSLLHVLPSIPQHQSVSPATGEPKKMDVLNSEINT